ncbi:MAG: hypothetical protein Q9195_003392 [Heterodermia aff. obscurata]
MEPNIRKLNDLIQVSYNLPHRVHTARTYPLRSPNGSTIIICGHETGLTFLWRGGLPMKPLAEAEESVQKQTNGAGATNLEPMTIESDDDEPETGTLRPSDDRLEFEGEAQEFDPSTPIAPVIQTLNLSLEAQVLHLSFLQMPTNLGQSLIGSFPSIISQKVLVAVACSDCSVRVLTIPLTPPSNRSKYNIEPQKQIQGASAGQDFYHAQMLVLSASSGHRSYPKGISMTLAAHSTTEPKRVDGVDNEPPSWDLLIASHSADMSGLLLIHRIAILADGSGLDTDGLGSIEPWRKQSLAAPAKAMSFNSSICPAPRHSQLLVAEAKGPVRIFDCLAKPGAGHGPWLLSLYPPWAGLSTNARRRKGLLTAQWILGGKAIAVLLDDGEWGIWEIEHSGPKPKELTDGWQALPGMSFVDFSISGWIGNSFAEKEASKSSKVEIRSQLTPMTPATRKIRQESLFTGPDIKVSSPVRGGIAVCSISDDLKSRKDDETLLLWLGNSITKIPSLLTYWQNRVRGSGNLFGNGAQGQPKELNDIHLGGELRNDVSLIPAVPGVDINTKPCRQSSILIAGEHRITIITPPLLEPSTPLAPVTSKPEVRSPAADQAMLEKGKLDIEGIDTFLAKMSNSHQTNGVRTNGTISRKQTNQPIL